MIAFDTNMLVRVAVADHPQQLAVVRDLMANNTVFISRTVLLETEWVLRSRYKKIRSELLGFFQALLLTQDVEVESAASIEGALDWYAQGADFADALHLSACGQTLMHTFDQDFCKTARATGAAPPVRVFAAE
ncbi:MAG: type II toxin-antitoxin system VapC family toxin [Rhodoferax sp.]|nr:type II toxin-antitoxin system VapC family toxin [Rhodoferax sp.]NCP54694.1 type II toxin-antitoxin system VapC family toxin [Rhodoferax sp.]OIP23331.1 MAG: VapC toxin family PIN domain ribonuclease [Comamonadaceae bacterium CG2_30_60_41]PIW06448.1 MAG: VapC toxin family PIN domain ribonuclease [Comamonadaceae bacterium CG17_big_fil_post_rev_8_21_14_2_50_60_13]PJC12401.1 MAG: VapC toxin family PIN domain ribonuclease [Comamonadaceae bacterium CG_4_9_14_0_8_um_filter_60_18]